MFHLLYYYNVKRPGHPNDRINLLFTKIKIGNSPKSSDSHNLHLVKFRTLYRGDAL